MNIIITGVTSGIGYDLIQKFAESKSNKIIGIARNKNKLLELKKIVEHKYNNFNFYPIHFDLNKIEDYDFLKREILIYFTKIDILINNAGTLTNRDFSKTEIKDLDLIFKTNFYSPYFLTQTLLDNFNLNSHIVNLSSMGGVQGSIKFAGLSAYSASKAAICNLTECLALELSNRSIFVNTIALGSVQTEMFNAAFPNVKAALSTHEAADFIHYFATNGHIFFNGKIIPASKSTP